MTNKFFSDCEAVRKSTAAQDAALLAEIRADQKALATTRTVSSMGEELKVSFVNYEGSENGWNAYLSLYSDGVLLYTDNFIVKYEALSGKKAPNMATEFDEKVFEEYTNTVDMYNSLLTRGDPIIYFEIDYNVTAEADDKPSEYRFNFSRIRVINTVSGKTTQTSALSKAQPRTMQPEMDLREAAGVVEKEKENLNILERYFSKGKNLFTAKQSLKRYVEVSKAFGNSKMISIPEQKFAMLSTEATQKLYTVIMGVNPSGFKGENNPVERVSWYDAIYFCNELSECFGYTSVYSVNGNTDVSSWGYTPHQSNSIHGEISWNTKADGFRLPTEAEWEYAARGGQNFTYAGSNNLDTVGWYKENSKKTTHPVAQKKPNGYGLYDMSGNVWEWVWDSGPRYGYHWSCGGSWHSFASSCGVSDRYSRGADIRDDDLGFRVVRPKY